MRLRRVTIVSYIHKDEISPLHCVSVEMTMFYLQYAKLRSLSQYLLFPIIVNFT